MANFEKLKVREKSIKLAENIYKMCENNQKLHNNFSLKDQIQRSAVSIASNIAEGSERSSDKEFIRYCFISRGSCAELKTQLIIIRNLGYLKEDEFKKINEELTDIHKMLNGMIKTLATNINLL